MDSNYLQQQRFLLQKKVKRLNSCDYKLFHSLVVQFWGYLRSHSLYAGVLAKLAAEAPPYVDEVAATSKGNVYLWDTEQDAVHFCFRVWEYCASEPLGKGNGPEVMIGRGIAGGSKFAEMLEGFRDAYLEPFYEYLDEALDGQAAVLSLLLKYKRHVEWFEREEVNALVSKGGERTVAKHMYAYLFDQGLEFHIEPQSISGEADLVAPELVLDAKLFDGNSSSHGKRYVLSGVNQLLTYTRDFHQQVGYLVVYRTCQEDLQFSFARTDMLVPFMVIDGRTIYFLVVDVCEYGASASKRGLLKTHVISEDEVRTVIKEQASLDSSSAPPPAEPATEAA
ncbi:hypothetical protein [Polaromonas naphthalenivorans]|uniref:Uncharacterized protein n=1 Tax=Polaromonas naphthalenivorans (strain CJ2) TaxID=365044 RepID=A1VWJ7_POLNA|nr:hypothetical protein [Polaromonas naphthalenivorans]ABM40025.1 hypothetical protein Pnap_4964 [Polaromonas naphthalenivorans CJ2]